ncbi:YdgA family protein, partial [Photobacterium sp. ZSDE20]|nr:YdgA family protein [Photobacterium sp. ZSDE20]
QSKIIVENDGKNNQVTVAIPNSIVMSVSGAPVVIEDVVSQFEIHNGELINRIKVDNVSLGSQPLASNLESIKSITLGGDKIGTDLTLTADSMGSYSNINASLNLTNWRSENLIDMLDSITKFNGTHNADNQLQFLNTLVGLADDGASLSLKVPGIESAHGVSSLDLSLRYPENNGVTRDNALSVLENLTGSLNLDTTLNDIQQFVPIMLLQHMASNSFIDFDSKTNRVRSEVTLANSIASINGQQISL